MPPADFTIKGFTMNGKPLVTAGHAQLITYLESLPFKELRSGRQLSADVGICRDSAVFKRPDVLKHRVKISGQYVAWGSRKTIRSLKRNLEVA